MLANGSDVASEYSNAYAIAFNAVDMLLVIAVLVSYRLTARLCGLLHTVGKSRIFETVREGNISCIIIQRLGSFG